jgi:hypothetical protein
MADTSFNGGEGSSLDELALSLRPTQQYSARARSKTPLSYKSPNVRRQILNFDTAPTLRGTSPSKSMILETPAKPGSSPWRIKVTVEAEPHSDDLPGRGTRSNTPSKPSVAKGRSITVPLKDADPSPAKRGRGRPRKSEVVTPAASAIKKRKGTPMRRRSTRPSGDKNDLTEDANAPKPTPKRRGRPPKNLQKVDVPLEISPVVDAAPQSQPPPSSRDKHQPSGDLEAQFTGNQVHFGTDRSPSFSSNGEQPSYHASPEPSIIQAELEEQPSPSPLRQQVITSTENTQPIANSFSELPTFADMTPLHLEYPISDLPSAIIARTTQKRSPYKRTPRDKLAGEVWSMRSREIISSPELYGLASHRLEVRRDPQPVNFLRGSPRRHENLSPSREAQQSSIAPSLATRADRDEDEENIQKNSTDVHNSDETPVEDKEDDMVDKSYEHGQKADQLDADEDVEMWRHMITTRQRDVSTRSGGISGSDSDDSDFGDEMEVTNHPMGENTMMQSEEFSMVSLDSLRELQSSFIDGGHADSLIEQAVEPQKRISMVSQIQLPDITSKAVRPLFSLVQSHKPAGSQPPLHKELSPKIARTAEASNTLQEALSSPSQPVPSRHSNQEHEQRASISGTSFAAKPNPDPRTSRQSNNLDSASTPKLGSSFQRSPLPEMTPSEIRLPTPSSTEKDMELADPPRNDGVEHPSFRQPFLDPITRSPAKSEGEMSVQTQTPPSTRRGSSTSSEEDQEALDTVQKSPIFRGTPTSNRVLEKEAEWQRAREEVSRTIQDARADQVVVIHSEEEEEENDDNDEADPSDIWQEEASRSSNLHQSSRIDEPQSPEPKHANKLGAQIAHPKEHRRPAYAKNMLVDGSIERKRKHGSELRNTEGSSTKITNSAQISALFRSVATHEQQHVSIAQVEDGAESVGQNDSGLFWQRELPSLLDHHPDVEDRTKDKVAVHSSHRTKALGNSQGRRPKDSGHYRPSILDSSPAKSSPLRRRLSFSQSMSPNRNDSHADVINSSPSFMKAYASPSNVRHLRNELRTSRGYASLRAVNGETRRIPTKTTSVDDPVEDTQESMGRSSLLSITPKGIYKPLFPTSKSPDQEDQPRPLKSRKTTASSTASTGVKTMAASTDGLLSWVWSRLPFTYTPPPHPTHPLLAGLPLLPRVEPWTRTHYEVMDKLYQLYKGDPYLFSTSHPDNTGLMTPSLVPFIDIEISNWGYRVRLNSNLIILASLFTRLLVLHDISEYERVAGESIDVGECSTRSNAEQITQWRVLFKLFSVEAGEMLRRDEALGKPIDRTDRRRWRFKGEEQWIWRKDLTKADESGLHLLLRKRESKK